MLVSSEGINMERERLASAQRTEGVRSAVIGFNRTSALQPTRLVHMAEGSVARSARRLRLSPSAMSRALARLSETTGDALLVRAGPGLVLDTCAAIR
jgi:hypothetical protein